MNRSLRELLTIVGEVKTVYADYQKAATDGKISVEEGLKLAGEALAVLVKHNVTLAELQEIISEIAPVLALVK